ncbi:flagellar assembly protein FliX [uncultured Sneathiella sp.]|uniref:flagellar assembly protein FliX n=1 Tax=uncultured Sneathiella sp. TaxID=879315 RepID=UPI0030EE4C7C|tara:strand:+ start:1589 stop:2008 length:420 start_codon:yes stop_codon:yes gene_type:complete
MKVGGPGRASSTASSKGGKAAQKSGAKFSVESEPVETASAGGVASSSPISSIEALVALQGIDGDEPRSNKRAIAKGEDLLTKLETLRDGMLSGNLTADKLKQLQETLSSYKTDGADPELKQIIDEIEVRAAVELAKFGY